MGDDSLAVPNQHGRLYIVCAFEMSMNQYSAMAFIPALDEGLCGKRPPKALEVSEQSYSAAK